MLLLSVPKGFFFFCYNYYLIKLESKKDRIEKKKVIFEDLFILESAFTLRSGGWEGGRGRGRVLSRLPAECKA